MCCCTSSWNGHTLCIPGIHNDDIFHSMCHSGFTQVFYFAEFVKNCIEASHGENYRNNLWVLNNRKKIKLSKTSFLRYYMGDRFQRPHNEAIHSDKAVFFS